MDALLRGIIALCKSLSLATLAEGIEHESQLSRASKNGLPDWPGVPLWAADPRRVPRGTVDCEDSRRWSALIVTGDEWTRPRGRQSGRVRCSPILGVEGCI